MDALLPRRRVGRPHAQTGREALPAVEQRVRSPLAGLGQRQVHAVERVVLGHKSVMI